MLDWLVFQIRAPMWLCRLTLNVRSIAPPPPPPHLQKISRGNNCWPCTIVAMKDGNFCSYSFSSSFLPAYMFSCYSFVHVSYLFPPYCWLIVCLSKQCCLILCLISGRDHPTDCASACKVVQAAWCMMHNVLLSAVSTSILFAVY
jgi:hypothetical protein